MVDNIASLSRSGLVGWVVQRVSSVVLAAYLFFFCGYFFLHTHVTFLEWRDLFHQSSMRLFTLLTLLSLILHSWVGIWTIITDYIKPPALRGFVEVLMIVTLILFFVCGVSILLG